MGCKIFDEMAVFVFGDFLEVEFGSFGLFWQVRPHAFLDGFGDTGRGNPMNAINQRTAPNEKNQNGSAAHRCWATVARAKAVKNVWVRIAQTGSRKIPKTNFTQRVGTR